MKKLLAVLLLALSLSAAVYARGGASSGGHGGGGGGHSSVSSSRGGFSSGSVSRPTAAPAPRTTTTTTTTTTRSASYGGRYVGGPVAYGGLGMGYGYSNGLLTGLIIGNIMHPHNTVVYSGPGAYSNNALLYPDGRVVSQSGQQVGVYQNGAFTPIQNGTMVAQPVPADAMMQPAQPVVVHSGPTVGQTFAIVFLTSLLVFLLVVVLL